MIEILLIIAGSRIAYYIQLFAWSVLRRDKNEEIQQLGVESNTEPPNTKTRVITSHCRRRCVPTELPSAERSMHWRMVSSRLVVNALEK